MNNYFKRLELEICEYYFRLALDHGTIPKLFTLVNGDGVQYLFFMNQFAFDINTELGRVKERDFLTYIVQEHQAVCYARGALFVEKNNQQSICVTFLDKNSPLGIECISYVTRKSDGKPESLTPFKRYKSPKEKIIFDYFNYSEPTKEYISEFQTLWGDMKGKIMQRDMR